ncbi:MAG: N-acetyltransferase [Sphingomonadaceae bacterium]
MTDSRPRPRRAAAGSEAIAVRPVASRADRAAFIALPYRLYADDPHWVPPLKSEVRSLLDEAENPWFGHAEAALFLARRGERVVGRVSAQIDRLVLAQPESQGGGPGTGQFGLFEAEDEETAAALLAAAEDWLRARGMSRVLGPFSLSIWDEPGLLVKGHDHSPTIMMGHHKAEYEGWIEAAGYVGVKDLLTYELDIGQPMPPLIGRIVASGERNPRIRVRRVEKSRFAAETAVILSILNDAWSSNWGFVPLTEAEKAYGAKKLKPVIYEDLVRIAELDGEPVAFMITLPDVNEVLEELGGSLFPFGWLKLLRFLRKPRTRTMRVPLMGVVRRLQASRLASQLAFMMIEHIRRDAISRYGATRGEIGWILDDNKGMRAIAEMIESRVNRVYRVYAKAL